MPKKGNSQRPKTGLNVKQKKEVRTMIEGEQEFKFHHVNNRFTPVQSAATVGALVPLTNVTQGPGDEQRIGDTVKLKSIRFSYRIDCKQSAENIRVLLVQWKQQDSATYAPVLGELLQSPSSVTNAGLLSPYNQDNLKSDMFQVLYDKVHAMDQGGGSQTPAQLIRSKKIDIKYAKKNIQFVGGSNYGTNKLFLWVITNVPNTLSEIDPFVQISFTDS